MAGAEKILGVEQGQKISAEWFLINFLKLSERSEQERNNRILVCGFSECLKLLHDNKICVQPRTREEIIAEALSEFESLDKISDGIIVQRLLGETKIASGYPAIYFFQSVHEHHESILAGNTEGYLKFNINCLPGLLFDVFYKAKGSVWLRDDIEDFAFERGKYRQLAGNTLQLVYDIATLRDEQIDLGQIEIAEKNLWPQTADFR
jgi:hypothetical protein